MLGLPAPYRTPGQYCLTILPLGNNKAVLRIPFLQEFNPKIDWVIGLV